MTSATEATIRRAGMVKRGGGVLAKVLLALLVAGAALLQLPGAVAAASGPVASGCGTFSVAAPTNVESRTAGGNLFVTDTVTGTLSGFYSGSVVAQRQYVVHPNGTITGQVLESFTGSVAGQTGGLVFRLVFTGDAAAGTFAGSFIILSGTGGLTNVHGAGTFSGSLVTGAGDYCGQVVAP